MRRSVLCAAVVLGGCTTRLATSPVPSGLPAVVGIPYTLPALQYRATITRTLTDCTTAGGRFQPEFDVSVEVTPAYVEGETFVADYRALSGASKTSAVRIDSFDNHTIRTVNAEADDKGPAIVAGVAKAGFSIARLALGLPAGPADLGGGAPSKLTCPATVALAEKVTAAIKAKTAELDGLNAELEPYLVAGLIATLTDADRTAISGLRAGIRDASKTLSELREKLAEQEKTLSTAESVDLDFSAGALDRTIPFPSADPAVAAQQTRWIANLFGSKATAAELAQITAQMKPLAAALRRLGAASAAASVCDDVGLPGCAAARPVWDQDDRGRLPQAIPGIAYRQPVKARLRICREVTAAICAGGGARPIVEAEAWAPQIGMLVVLPFTNGFGANNQLQAQFRADGSLEWASYSEKRATGLAAVDTVNTVLDGGLSLSGAIATARTADAAAAATGKVAAAQNALAAAEAESRLVAVQAAMDPANQAAARQQALLDARVAQLTSEVKVRELEAKLQQ